MTNFTEAETRQRYIDSELAAAGWAGNNLSLVEEFALGSAEIVREDSSMYGEKRGFVDYVLVGKDGKPLAVGWCSLSFVAGSGAAEGHAASSECPP